MDVTKVITERGTGLVFEILEDGKRVWVRTFYKTGAEVYDTSMKEKLTSELEQELERRKNQLPDRWN